MFDALTGERLGIVDLVLRGEEIKRKTTKKERVFIDKLLACNDFEIARKAARMSEKNALEILSDQRIQDLVDYQKERTALRNNITQDYFVEELKKIIETDKSIVKNKIDALELLAKITGNLKENQNTQQQLVVLKMDNS